MMADTGARIPVSQFRFSGNQAVSSETLGALLASRLTEDPAISVLLLVDPLWRARALRITERVLGQMKRRGIQ